jgi:hypothetical protein
MRAEKCEPVSLCRMANTEQFDTRLAIVPMHGLEYRTSNIAAKVRLLI